MAIDRIGIQPVVAVAGQAWPRHTYKVGEVTADGEVASLEVSCCNDISIEGNVNIIHWRGEGDSYRVYRAADGGFGLIGTTDGALFVDSNLAPDINSPPPEA